MSFLFKHAWNRIIEGQLDLTQDANAFLSDTPIIEGDSPIRMWVEFREWLQVYAHQHRIRYGFDDPYAAQAIEYATTQINAYLAQDKAAGIERRRRELAQRPQEPPEPRA